MSESYYDTAQICLNGHVINISANVNTERNQNYCVQCGEETITECLSCNAPIRGKYNVPGIVKLGYKYTLPKYCYNCGRPYPWTVKSIEAAKELATEVDNLTEEEKELLKKSIDDLVKEGPNQEVAQSRFKRLISKVGPEFVNGFKNILTDILSETIKKSIWG